MVLMDTPIFAIAVIGFDKQYIEISATCMVSHLPSQKQIIDNLYIVCHIKTSIGLYLAF